ncbi:MAG: hypothetical protein ABJB98_02245 [Actinomycetota bacterium]
MHIHLFKPSAAVLAAATLVVALVGPSAGAADATSDRTGSQPLPGYTISNPPLAPITVAGQPTKVIQGVFNHAAFDLEVPPHWNGQLVLWAHGYRGQGTVLTVDPPGYGLRQTFANEGYAWAASSYYDNGYDVAAGVISTHDLARYSARLLHRQPKQTYIVGVSMGGHVIGRSLEQYPMFYSGAMPMCGVLGDNRLFDFFLDYNLVAQDLAGIRAYPPPANYLTAVVPTIQHALGLDGLTPGGPDTTNALGKQLRDVTINRSGGPRPGDTASFAVWKNFLFSLLTPDNGGTLAQNPGRVAQNVGRSYVPNYPVNLDATVQRVPAADPWSRQTTKLIQIPRILGKPHVPVLTLHGLGDMFVPFSMEQIYSSEVGASGESKLLVQRAIREAGHCEYTPTEVGRAWTDLQGWVQAKGAKARAAARPAGDDVTNPTLVAAPTYGCRFTDPTAYADQAHFPTRALYPPCPSGS